MMKNDNLNTSESKWHPCSAMCGGRNSGLFWGVLFIVIGLYWFGKAAGWFPTGIHMFWPIVLVLAGLGLLVSAWTRQREHH